MMGKEMDKEKFNVTEEHMKLLKQMWVSWDDCEFGAPEIDPKRPYGNSDVYDDMAEILGIKKPDVEDWVLSDAAPSAKLCKRLDKLHKEMETVLQILVRNPEGISPGRYGKEKYDANWRRAE